VRALSGICLDRARRYDVLIVHHLVKFAERYVRTRLLRTKSTTPQVSIAYFVSQELGESDAGRDSLRLTTLFEHVLIRSRGSIIREAEAAADSHHIWLW
jgi:hypothetical protein